MGRRQSFLQGAALSRMTLSWQSYPPAGGSYGRYPLLRTRLAALHCTFWSLLLRGLLPTLGYSAVTLRISIISWFWTSIEGWAAKIERDRRLVASQSGSELVDLYASGAIRLCCKRASGPWFQGHRAVLARLLFQFLGTENSCFQLSFQCWDYRNQEHNGSRDAVGFSAYSWSGQ